MKVGRAVGFCPSLVPEGFPSGPGETASLRSPGPILAKMSHIESPLCRERESTVSAPSPLSCTLGLLSGCVPAGARLPWGGWYSPREYSMCCMVLSLAGVPGVPLIPFPGQARRGDASRLPTDAQWPQLLYQGLWLSGRC